MTARRDDDTRCEAPSQVASAPPVKASLPRRTPRPRLCRHCSYASAVRDADHRHSFGVFDDPVEAAKARDRAAYELYGEYAYLNSPEDFSPREEGNVKREA